MSSPRILITGMSGLIGGIARRQLEGSYELRALNRRQLTDVDCHCADIGDLDAILPAFDDVDTVIHLAAFVAMDAPWEKVLHNNVIGTYNVFEASRQAGVRRVIFASAGAAISGWERETPWGALVDARYDEVPPTWDRVTHELPCRPTGLYGCSKAWGEALAWHFVDSSDLSIINLRICSVPAENRPLRPRDFSIWCSHGDLGRIIQLCVELPNSVRYDTFFAQSDNQWAYRDIQHARDVLGYEPQDRAEDHRPGAQEHDSTP
jgi:nucleoside-diphosphate-sugar epimerase